MGRIRLTNEIYMSNDGFNSKGRQIKLDYIWIGDNSGKCMCTLEGSQLIGLKAMLKSIDGVRLAKRKTTCLCGSIPARNCPVHQ